MAASLTARAAAVRGRSRGRTRSTLCSQGGASDPVSSHPFKDTPQYRQVYGPFGEGRPGNGLGRRLRGVDPVLWHDENEEGLHYRRVSYAQHQQPEYDLADELEERPTVMDVIDSADLTEKQKFVICLRYGLRDGRRYTQKEVAEFMGISVNAVWKHEKAARKKMEGVLFE